MKNAIKQYLEEACQTDQALAEKYDESKLDECVNFINLKAKELYIKQNGKRNGCIGIERNSVFQWARHFFQEGCPKVDESFHSVEPKETKTDEEKEKKEKPTPKVTSQLDLFGGAE